MHTNVNEKEAFLLGGVWLCVYTFATLVSGSRWSVSLWWDHTFLPWMQWFTTDTAVLVYVCLSVHKVWVLPSLYFSSVQCVPKRCICAQKLMAIVLHEAGACMHVCVRDDGTEGWCLQDSLSELIVSSFPILCYPFPILHSPLPIFPYPIFHCLFSPFPNFPFLILHFPIPILHCPFWPTPSWPIFYFSVFLLGGFGYSNIYSLIPQMKTWKSVRLQFLISLQE